MYKNMLVEDRNAIAREYYGLSREYVENFTQCASVARNISAHGARLYNRVKMRPSVDLPKRLKSVIDNDKPAAYLYAIFALLPDSEKYPMLTQIARAFRKYPFAKPQYLGLPENWFSLFESIQ